MLSVLVLEVLMDKRMNAGYEIINSITVGKSEIVLGYNEMMTE